MSLRLKAKDFLLEVKRVRYSLVRYFVKLGRTECVCLCIWNLSLLLLSCFCSWVLQLITHVLNVLVVSSCKPVIHKLKILCGGNWNVENQWGEPQKGGGGTFWNFSGGSKRGDTIFDSNLVGGTLEGTMHNEGYGLNGHHHNLVEFDLDCIHFWGVLIYLLHDFDDARESGL